MTRFLAVLFVFCVGCQKQNEYQAPPPPEVIAAKPVQQTINHYLEVTGRTEAVGRSELSARVQGFLEEVKFEAGQKVNAGDVLYQIEESEFVALRDGAQAELESAKASLEAATANINVSKADLVAADVKIQANESEFSRQDQLYKEKVVSKSVWEEAKAQLDSAKASRLQAEAAIKAAEANESMAKAQVSKAEASLNKAELNLSYTKVRALISGHVAKTNVNPGNLVASGTHLTTIVPRDYIWAYFNVSERALLAFERQGEEKKEENELRKIKAYLQRAGDEGFPFVGHLDYFDQEGIDQDTGTLMMRAGFENGDQRLFPGLFVRIRVPVGILENAILVPETAIGRDQAGPYLLTVGEDGTVARTGIELGPKNNNMIVVTKGLSSDQVFITEGLLLARPGSKVQTKMTTLEFEPEQELETLPAESESSGPESSSQGKDKNVEKESQAVTSE